MQHLLDFFDRYVHGGGNALLYDDGFRQMMASRLPVSPVRLQRLNRVLHHTWRWPRRGTAQVTFGAPLHLEGEDYAALARTVEQAVIGSLPEPLTPARPDAD